MAGIALAARLRASEDERARRDREEAARVQGTAKSSEALKQVVVESEVRRRRLGQRTSANELSQEGVQRVLRRGGCYIIVSFSLESAKASFEQAVLSEALFASFEPRVPTVAMTVDAAEDDCGAQGQVMASGGSAAGEEGQGETKPVDFHVFCLQPRAEAAGAQ